MLKATDIHGRPYTILSRDDIGSIFEVIGPIVCNNMFNLALGDKVVLSTVSYGKPGCIDCMTFTTIAGMEIRIGLSRHMPNWLRPIDDRD